ncbi:MAG: glutamate 5-kinase, partial [Acidobacteriota bacterium]
KLIPETTNIEEPKSLVEERDSGLGTGGMNSKLEAAMLCQTQNIETWIVGGSSSNFLVNAFSETAGFTRFPVAPS